jgi:hypothetical protein
MTPETSILTIENSNEQVAIPAGAQLAFGRGEGPLQIAVSDDRVSRQHGIIGNAGLNWYVQSTSKFYGFTVYDCETPSRLHVPPNAGPLFIPFGWAIVSIEVLGDRYCFEVRGEGAVGWNGSWATHLREQARPVTREMTGQTRYAWQGLNVRGRDGKVLQWYRALVAMCEPRLANPPVDRIPTDSEIARRLGISPKTLEKHRDRLRDELGFNKYDDQMRLAAVILALSQGLVTAKDLFVLEMQEVEL